MLDFVHLLVEEVVVSKCDGERGRLARAFGSSFESSGGAESLFIEIDSGKRCQALLGAAYRPDSFDPYAAPDGAKGDKYSASTIKMSLLRSWTTRESFELLCARGELRNR